MDAKAAQRLEVCFRSCICDHFQECVFNATTLTMSRIAPVNVKRKPKMSYERGVLLPSRCFQFENHFQKITLRLLDELFSIEAIDRICRRDHCECLFNPICFSSTIINSIISVGVLLDCLSDREDVKPSPQIRKNIRNCSVIMLLQAFSCVSVILHRIDWGGSSRIYRNKVDGSWDGTSLIQPFFIFDLVEVDTAKPRKKSSLFEVFVIFQAAFLFSASVFLFLFILCSWPAWRSSNQPVTPIRYQSMKWIFSSFQICTHGNEMNFSLLNAIR